MHIFYNISNNLKVYSHKKKVLPPDIGNTDAKMLGIIMLPNSSGSMLNCLLIGNKTKDR